MPTLLNVFVPGLGQLIQGRIIAAMLCFVLTVVGYICFVVPGLLMHVLTLADSYSYSQRSFARMLKESR